MQLIKNFAYNASYQIFILIVPLITTPYLSRTLGPSGVGINSYTGSIMQYFIIFGCLGTNIYASRKIAFVRDDREKLSQTFWEIFILRAILLLISLVFFYVSFIYFNHEFLSYYVAQSISIMATIFDISWFFMGIEKFSVTVMRNFIVKIISVICIFIFVKSFSDLFLYILIISLSGFVGNISMFNGLKGEILKPSFNKINIIQHFVPSVLLFIPEIATQIYLILNKTMLGAIISVQASGFFDQSDKIVKIILAVVTATGTVMLPHVANAFSNGEIGKTKQYLYDSFNMVTCISIPMFFGLVAISSKLVPLFFSNKFLIVSPLMKIESIIVVLIAWSNAIGMQYLLPTRQTKKYTVSVIIGAMTNIILNIPLIIMFQTYGAVVATVLSELFVTLYQMYSVRKQISIKLLFNDFYRYTLSGIIMFAIVYYINMKTATTWSLLFLEILIGVCVYGLMVLILNTSFIKIVKKVKNE